MRAILWGVALTIALGDSVHAQKQQSRNAEFKQLLSTFNSVAGGFRKDTSDKKRKETVDRLEGLGLKFLAFAKKRDDVLALKALRQAVQTINSRESLAHHASEMNRDHFPAGGSDDDFVAVVAYLKANYVERDDILAICDRMRYAVRPFYEPFLKDVVDRNKKRNIKAMATLALAQLKRNHLNLAQLAAQRPELMKRYRRVYGSALHKLLDQSTVPQLENEVVERYKRALAYADVELPYGGPIGPIAKAQLFDIQHLSIGKVAPEIKGVDQDGKPMSLHAYKGKVVLLYFWQEF